MLTPVPSKTLNQVTALIMEIPVLVPEFDAAGTVEETDRSVPRDPLCAKGQETGPLTDFPILLAR